MTNPYEASTTAIPAAVRSNGAPAARAWLAAGLSCALLSALATTLVVPHFAEVFESFGADLPLLTKLLVHYYLAMWASPAAVIAAWYFWPAPRRRGLASGLIGVATLVLSVPLFVVALYWPIFKLSAAI
ncbi:hypothetical protein GCM10027430_35730 [Lysobacter tyrosinilyticus]